METCPICYDKIEDKDLSILKCNHKFHAQCILETYKHNRDTSKNSYTNIRVCPYCRADGGYLELLPNMFPLKRIHNEWNILNNQINICNINNISNNKLFNKLIYPYLNKNNCFAILKTGKNKGTQCSKKQNDDSNYCHIHNKFKRNK